MRLLVGFEESGRVTEAFLKKGVDAYSCDLLPTSGNFPDLHIQADFLVQILLDGVQFQYYNS